MLQKNQTETFLASRQLVLQATSNDRIDTYAERQVRYGSDAVPYSFI